MNGLRSLDDVALLGSARRRAKPTRHRASHTKSRTGCYTCKSRRVKCDEERPVCSACSLRGSSCSYPKLAPGQSKDKFTTTRGTSIHDGKSASPRELNDRPSKRFHGSVDQRGTTLQPLEFHLTGVSINQPPGNLNMKDLNLLQHFLRKTSHDMSFDTRRARIWEEIMPDLAANHEFVMHLLLALAGVHLLSKQLGSVSEKPEYYPDDHLDASGITLHDIVEHHQKGLQGFRAVLSTVSSTTAETVLCGSTLLVGFALASLKIRDLDRPQDAPEFGDIRHLRLDWLHLIRGLTIVVEQHWPTLKTGRLRSLFYYRHANDDWKFSTPSSSTSSFPRLRHCSKRLSRFASGASAALFGLCKFMNTLPEVYNSTSDNHNTPVSRPSADSYSFDIEEVLAGQKAAISTLEEMYMRILHVFEFTASENDDQTQLDVERDMEDAAVISWPDLVSNAFICSLNYTEESTRIQGASLVILAHFYLIFTLFENFWFFKGSFEGEIAQICTRVERLDSHLLSSLIRWPMEVVS